MWSRTEACSQPSSWHKTEKQLWKEGKWVDEFSNCYNFIQHILENSKQILGNNGSAMNKAVMDSLPALSLRDLSVDIDDDSSVHISCNPFPRSHLSATRTSHAACSLWNFLAEHEVVCVYVLFQSSNVGGKLRTRPCRSSVGQLLAFHRGKLGSSPGSAHVVFVVDKVARGQVFSEYFDFPYQLLQNHHRLRLVG
jgi:hypothetical protein